MSKCTRPSPFEGCFSRENGNMQSFSDLYCLPKTSHPAQDEGEALNKTNEKIMLFISLLRERTTPDLYLSQVPFPIVKNLAQCLLVPETQIFVE